MEIAFPNDRTSLYALGHVRFLRAEILSELGRQEEALSWYASIPGRPLYDLVFMAPSHRRQAEIHERLGNPEKAAEHYARFIELWNESDPELQPLVADARSKLSGLRGTAQAGH